MLGVGFEPTRISPMLLKSIVLLLASHIYDLATNSTIPTSVAGFSATTIYHVDPSLGIFLQTNPPAFLLCFKAKLSVECGILFSLAPPLILS